MTQLVPRRVVQAFYQAYATREAHRIAPFLDEAVEWRIAGPDAVLPFCGLHRGKAAVVDLFERQFPRVLERRGFEPEELLIDGDRAALFAHLTAKQISSGRIVRYSCAQFSRFRDEKLVSMRVLVDSLNAAEQLIGRTIDFGLTERQDAGDLIAL